MAEHKTHEELQKLIDEASRKITVGAKYYHYKHPNQHYELLGFEFREETEEICVAYKALYGAKLTWNRLVSEFLKPVVIDDQESPRFIMVE